MRNTSSVLVAMVMILLCVGIVMLASTSSVRGEASFKDPDYFLKRQLVWLGISLVAGFIASRLDYHWWQRLAVPLAVVSVVALVLVLVTPAVKGSHRWFRIGPLSVQPSEMAKIAVIAMMSAYMCRISTKARLFLPGFLYPLVALALVLGLLLLEPDFGATVLIGLVGMLIMFAGGTNLWYLLGAGAVGGAGMIALIMRDPVRSARVLAFWNPDLYAKQAYHVIQSKAAFIRGGLFGVGLGESLQKQLYLPEAHTDFILPIIGEELGFIATAGILMLFFGILICGLIITYRAKDAFGRLMAFGITMLIVLQASINVGVVTGCGPTKGLPLPFISYGGSSLLVCVAGIGVLLNIASQAEQEKNSSPVRSRRRHA